MKLENLSYSDLSIIERALLHWHSHCVNQAVRKRTATKKEKAAAVREEWQAKEDAAHDVLCKVSDVITTLDKAVSKHSRPVGDYEMPDKTKQHK
jgi:hypothetical protein